MIIQDFEYRFRNFTNSYIIINFRKAASKPVCRDPCVGPKWPHSTNVIQRFVGPNEPTFCLQIVSIKPRSNLNQFKLLVSIHDPANINILSRRNNEKKILVANESQRRFVHAKAQSQVHAVHWAKFDSSGMEANEAYQWTLDCPNNSVLEHKDTTLVSDAQKLSI